MKHLLIVLFLFCAVALVHAQDANIIPPPIVVVGTGSDPSENPPDISQPTVNYVQCPVGYNCLTVDDYQNLFTEFKKFAEVLGTKNDFMDSIVQRLDAKLTQSETERQETLDIVKADQEQLKIKAQELAAATSKIDALTEKVKVTETQIEIIKAQNTAFYLLILVLALVSTYVFIRLQRHIKYWLKEFINWLPIKVN